jgi:hypothetical protein
MDNMAQVFLGVRIGCAQCHHHPYEKWSQAHGRSLLVQDRWAQTIRILPYSPLPRTERQSKACQEESRDRKARTAEMARVFPFMRATPLRTNSRQCQLSDASALAARPRRAGHGSGHRKCAGGRDPTGGAAFASRSILPSPRAHVSSIARGHTKRPELATAFHLVLPGRSGHELTCGPISFAAGHLREVP